MKYVAAYCLAVLSGNNSPSADDVKKILSSVGVEVDADKLSGLVNSLKGKNIHEVNYRFFFLIKRLLHLDLPKSQLCLSVDHPLQQTLHQHQPKLKKRQLLKK